MKKSPKEEGRREGRKSSFETEVYGLEGEIISAHQKYGHTEWEVNEKKILLEDDV